MNCGMRNAEGGVPQASRSDRQRGGGIHSALRTPRSAFGFTLLEVLVALAIFALAAVVMGATYINVLVAYEAATRRIDYWEDLKFVRSALLTEPDRVKAEMGDELDLGDNRRARWSAEIAPTETTDVFAVTWTCEITDPKRNAPQKTSQQFRLLRPTWSDPVERSQLRENARQRILELQAKASK